MISSLSRNSLVNVAGLQSLRLCHQVPKSPKINETVEDMVWEALGIHFIGDLASSLLPKKLEFSPTGSSTLLDQKIEDCYKAALTIPGYEFSKPVLDNPFNALVLVNRDLSLLEKKFTEVVVAQERRENAKRTEEPALLLEPLKDCVKVDRPMALTILPEKNANVVKIDGDIAVDTPKALLVLENSREVVLKVAQESSIQEVPTISEEKQVSDYIGSALLLGLAATVGYTMGSVKSH